MQGKMYFDFGDEGRDSRQCLTGNGTFFLMQQMILTSPTQVDQSTTESETFTVLDANLYGISGGDVCRCLRQKLSYFKLIQKRMSLLYKLY
jgi:hypothetical protein